MIGGIYWFPTIVFSLLFENPWNAGSHPPEKDTKHHYGHIWAVDSGSRENTWLKKHSYLGNPPQAIQGWFYSWTLRNQIYVAEDENTSVEGWPRALADKTVNYEHIAKKDGSSSSINYGGVAILPEDGNHEHYILSTKAGKITSMDFSFVAPKRKCDVQLL